MARLHVDQKVISLVLLIMYADPFFGFYVFNVFAEGARRQRAIQAQLGLLESSHAKGTDG